MAENCKMIMIIDDNEDIITMIKAMLEMKGYNVCIKTNAINLEESLEKVSPDLIIMGMLLSGADGREICKLLKNHGRFSIIPVLMISAHPNAKEECLNAGADSFLAKPFDMKDFFQSVEKSLALKNQ